MGVGAATITGDDQVPSDELTRPWPPAPRGEGAEEEEERLAWLVARLGRLGPGRERGEAVVWVWDGCAVGPSGQRRWRLHPISCGDTRRQTASTTGNRQTDGDSITGSRRPGPVLSAVCPYTRAPSLSLALAGRARPRRCRFRRCPAESPCYECREPRPW